MLNYQRYLPTSHIKAKSVLILTTTLIFTGCSSLGGGSVEKRSAKLANGIQKAYAVEPTTALRIAPMIVQSADRYNVDPLLVAAVIRQESSYRNYAVSPAGAIGLTQVIPRYWQQTCPALAIYLKRLIILIVAPIFSLAITKKQKVGPKLWLIIMSVQQDTIRPGK